MDQQLAARAVALSASISKEAVAIRLDPLNWPEGLDKGDPAGPVSLWRAIDDAAAVFREYEAVRLSKAALAPAAAHAADVEWIRSNLPGLLQTLADIRKRGEVFEASRRKMVMEALGPAPTEPADIALLQEIRSHLKGLPTQERTRRIFGFLENGDDAGV